LGKKRFSLEGGESTIAGLDAAINRGAELGVEEVVIGMAHRGRLNVLTNILQKPYEQVFLEFEEKVELEQNSDGDVKYHMGYSSDMTATNGKNVSLRLMPNPSHLEAVNPVVVGYARARADENYNHIPGQDKYDPVLPILIHGDAALAGQGIVYEVTQMSNLPAYYTGGTLHFVINNQVGFTTDFGDARSSIYCSDVAKIVDAPIFHVSGDDPEAVCYVMQLAIEFRQKFNRDVYIDMVCYRKYGHNESDEPRMTQPTMYKIIGDHVNPRDLYLKELQQKGVDTSWFQPMHDAFDAKLQDLLEAVKKGKVKYSFGKIKNTKLDTAVDALRFSEAKDFLKSPDTAISKEVVDKIMTALVTLPEGFTPLKQVEKVLESRKQFLEGTKDADWGIGELLAFGSILNEGHIVRFTGQDVQRGTFSHRHAVLHDVNTNAKYNNLSTLNTDKARFELYNSLLSEYGVMGFEFGYSMANPNSLVVWEAQFGDFSNGAQTMIDQFLVACESKWRVMSGIVLLLPHGYEGQGPEHSNARPERFLQLAAEYNMYVCNCSTPANLFHMLRRQTALPFRKPCINVTPKSGLRTFSSPKEDFLTGGFQEVIGDKTVDAKKVKKVILCTGKIYYELDKFRKDNNISDTAIVRIEQQHPFPKNQVDAELKKYKNAQLLWAQEEPENMGYWSYILRVMPEIGLGNCISRIAAASPAIGYVKKHDAKQADLIKEAFEFGKV
jgi:2-oxoglutarate dehydrogenase E1 component